ncbi:ABC transporter substrate-binding protein [Liquorilactobacillus nagelii]|uniref:ABC transporter substrate-binding protein n=1 Tax=Liquorilactobacillus nagelii TaxID=82688 RepID=UPI002286DBAD|nr:ABC transporter substrate-binding protein [Liquorilactobacillus nagelii]
MVLLGGGILYSFWYRPSQPHRQTTRVIATTTAITAIMAKLDVKLVAVPTTTQTLPQQYRKLPRVGNHVSINWQNLLAAKPDVVYVDSELADEYQAKLKEQKITMKALDLQTYPQMLKTIKYLGEKYGKQTAAKKLIAQLQIKTVHRKKHPRVLILMGMPGGSFLAMNNKSYLGELVEKAGGKVVGADPHSLYTSPNSEKIAQANPQIVIRLAHAMPTEVEAAFKIAFQADPYNQLIAVKNHHVYDVKAPVFSPTANLQVNKAYSQIKEWVNQVE